VLTDGDPGDGTIDPRTLSMLSTVSTATISSILLGQGRRNVWIRNAKPLREGLPSVVGPAFTMRFVPFREDLATPDSWRSPKSTRGAIEEMPEGCIVVVDALGTTNVGVFGDILCARMAKRGVRALISDGVVRDRSGISAGSLPVWCRGSAAPPSIAGLTFVGWQEPIGCGGVAVMPNDIVVADDDGAVVIPFSLVSHVASVGPEQERFEAWILSEVERGVSLPGLYPANDETRARYQQFLAAQGPRTEG
jgi:regulator of RNase E activity RraA